MHSNERQDAGCGVLQPAMLTQIWMCLRVRLHAENRRRPSTEVITVAYAIEQKASNSDQPCTLFKPRTTAS